MSRRFTEVGVWIRYTQRCFTLLRIAGRENRSQNEWPISPSRVIHFVKLHLSGLGDAKEPVRMVDSPLSWKAMVLFRIMEYPAR